MQAALQYQLQMQLMQQQYATAAMMGGGMNQF